MKSINRFFYGPTPEERVREWRQKLRGEERKLDREIRNVSRALGLGTSCTANPFRVADNITCRHPQDLADMTARPCDVQVALGAEAARETERREERAHPREGDCALEQAA